MELDQVQQHSSAVTIEATEEIWLFVIKKNCRRWLRICFRAGVVSALPQFQRSFLRTMATTDEFRRYTFVGFSS